MDEAYHLDDLPILTDIVEDDEEEVLPVVSDTFSNTQRMLASDILVSESVPILSEAQEQDLLRQLEMRVEALLKEKLRQHFAEIQQIAISQTLQEIQAELPAMLKQALRDSQNEFV